MAAIYKAMQGVFDDFPVVGKDQEADRYKFRGIDDALEALNPLLTKHGVFMLPQFTSANVTFHTRTNFRKQEKPVQHCMLSGTLDFVAAADGSKVSVALVGEGEDNADKALMKAQANALKYAVWYTFCVPTRGEKKDSEAFDKEDKEAPAAIADETVDEAKVKALIVKIAGATAEQLGTVRAPGPARKAAKEAAELLDATHPLRKELIQAVSARAAELK